MAAPQSDTQVKRWELEKSFKEQKWMKVLELCDIIGSELTNIELTYKIRALYMLKKYQKCFDICDKKLSSDNSLLFTMCRFELRSAIALGDVEKINHSLLNFYEMFPENIEPKVADMRLKYSKNKFKISLEIANSILSLEPDNFNAILFKARNLTKISQNNQSTVKSWEKVLSLSKNNIEAMNQLARIAIIKSNYKEADELIGKIMDIDPDYAPAHTSKSKLVSLMNNEESEYQLDMSKSYRLMYSESKYGDLIKSLGGLDNYKNWNLNESIFILRSLNRLKNYKKTISTYSNLNNNTSGPLLNEVIIAADKLDLDSLSSETLSLLAVSSRTDIDSMKYYVRHLIYSNMQYSHISSEIRELLTIHGKELLGRIVIYILKSGKYEIIGDIGIGTNYFLILDPIHGSLKNNLSDSEYSKIWSELDHKITHALSSNKKRTDHYPASFYNSYKNNGTFYPLFRMEDGEKIIMREEAFQETILKENIDELCNSIKPLSFILNEKSVNKDLILIFSNKYPENLIIPKNINILRFNVASNNNILYGEKFTVISDQENISHKEEISGDPRLNLGRFFTKVKHLDSNNLLSISWIMERINDSLPSEIYVHPSLHIAKVAAIMLGYPDKKIIEL